ncbi:glycosyltransferase family 2 protein [Marinobacter sp. ANT_B65]|uniref:glycosyltransferase family 2 protein n=1 Tax=Marinobacter sp. ANT_B65 TaxID=2039467 RepID=UPI000BBF22E0|nr:glycosyltransferase family 2 protein [Marinobacter sp. ANT_B65]PCM42803.1 glycosyl transferase [Marinobacter sp. ANT_B65]
MISHIKKPIPLLFVLGIAGALLSSGILTAATALLAIAGLVISYRKCLYQAGWDKPKELRLLHFAFWFFVLVSFCSWAIEGFGYEGGKTLATHGRFILFWPLVVALSYARLGASTLFTAAGLAAASVIGIMAATLIANQGPPDELLNSPFSSGLNPVIFEHIALLSSLLALTGGLFFFRSKRTPLAFLLIIAGAAGVAIAMLSQTRSSLIALPLLLILLVPLLNRNLHVISMVTIPVLLAAAIATNDHNDLLSIAAASSIPGILSRTFLIFIPLAIFARHLSSTHTATAHLAAAGSMVSVGYLMFGLAGGTFDHPLLLTFYLLSVAGIAAAMFNELSTSYVRQRTKKVSATIITKNEEDNIADCLKSARLVADEIIVLDSGSTDRTAEIAKQYADIVEITDWPGFGIQKQRALEKATGDWVLSLDADERITPELAREINHKLADPDADAYKLPWAVTIYGARLDFGRSGRAPLRLFRREGVRFSDALVHERILIPAGRKTKTLRGRLTHYTHRDFGHSLEKSAKYAWLGSLEKHRKGKKTRTMLYPTLRGLMTFVQVYFIRFGFLDGAVGYLTAVTYAQVTFNKYAGLWTLSGSPESARGGVNKPQR